MTLPALEVSFLEDGGQPAEHVADELGAFLDGAQRSLEIAIYDLNLTGVPADRLRAAIKAAVGRNVAVRLVYNADVPNPIPVPPPSEPDTALIESFGIPTRAVAGIPALMHHKYVVRDAETDDATVWTGSMNWTNDSWSREENIVLRLPSRPLASQYLRNFTELWTTGRVDSSGKYDLPATRVPNRPDGVPAQVFFSPGRGPRMVHTIAERLAHATRRIRLCSPVITAGPILGTLAELAGRPHVDFKGVYDRTQMREVIAQWTVDQHAGWKAPAFTTVISALPFASKVTTPYGPGTVHDYMHAKITVVDDTVFTGSYNLSHSGEENAENLLQLVSAPLADQCAAFIDKIYARYAAGAK
ncbi:MAG: phospholipase D-like domain-containing protein [Candidatus Dormibacteraeota bacterium]|nr:phospholipase D-like domain-containing protein [Candidatus Dormibacteraeota bacterium]